jgi:hypothetical protein
MSGDALAAALARAGEAAACAAIDRAEAALADAAAQTLPGVAVDREAGLVRLSAPGLADRAFGSRRRAADPRLAGLALLARSLP